MTATPKVRTASEMLSTQMDVLGVTPGYQGSGYRLEAPWRCPYCVNRQIRPCQHTPENWRAALAKATGSPS